MCTDVQKLEPSNCASGFWLQLPNALQGTWTFRQKTEWVELECNDMSRAGPARRIPWHMPIEGPWRYQVPSPHPQSIFPDAVCTTYIMELVCNATKRMP